MKTFWDVLLLLCFWFTLIVCAWVPPCTSTPPLGARKTRHK